MESDVESSGCSNNVQIIGPFQFSSTGKDLASKDELAKSKWPVVYFITGKQEAYVGETCNFIKRFSDHLDNPKRKVLDEMRVIYSETFNKSATLDLEQMMIRMVSSDGRYMLQNKNAGQSTSSYFQRRMYQDMMEEVWDKLSDQGLTNDSFDKIINSNLFKYSPYTALTPEQNEICSSILGIINKSLSGATNNDKLEPATILVEGAAGTGKTVLAMSMLFKLIATGFQKSDITGYIDEEGTIREMLDYDSNCRSRNLKIGFLVPMSSIRKTLDDVVKKMPGGKSDLVIGPMGLAHTHYDILFVDEAHRLARYKNLSNNGGFKTASNKLNLEFDKNDQLDWVMKQSTIRVLFFDRNQTVRLSDIEPDSFINRIKKCENYHYYHLESQLRCSSGMFYIKYLNNVLECKNPEKMEMSPDFKFEMFYDVDQMVDHIRSLNEKEGLCRVVSGFGWRWKTKKSKKNGDSGATVDIDIGRGYRWNSNEKGWVARKDSINEVGCIHSTQGFDLNYVGVIFGPEIDYDESKNEILINKANFF